MNGSKEREIVGEREEGEGEKCKIEREREGRN